MNVFACINHDPNNSVRTRLRREWIISLEQRNQGRVGGVAGMHGQGV